MKKRKTKISSVKQKTLKHTKLNKQGKLRGRKNKNKSLLPKKNKPSESKPEPQQEEVGGEESDHGEDMLQMIDKDDLSFLQNAVANNSYPLLNSVHYRDRKSCKRKKSKQVDEPGVEMQYEEEASQVEPKRKKHLLPIKTKDGLVHRTVDEDVVKEEEKAEETPEVKKEEEEDSDAEFERKVKSKRNEMEPKRPVSTAELLAAREEALRDSKLLIGVLASGLLEDPQAKVKNFHRLLELMNEKSPELRVTVCKLATLSLLEVFKDVIPSYQIKHQENTDVKLKKETFRLQKYEKTLLSSYKIYLQRLEKLLSVLDKKRGNPKTLFPQKLRLAELALHCMCDLLETHPYFNFAKNLMQMLVPYLNYNLPSVRDRAASCVKTLFKNDKKGEISLEIVRRINHLVKSHSHCVHAEVLNVCLHLRIKEINLDREKEEEMNQRKLMKHKQKLLTLSRKERKRSKRLEAVEKEMLETKAEENKQKKHHHMTEITKLVFTIYFRVLKKAPNSKILSVTLEGLARYAHCINLEFYQDIVNVLNELLEVEPLGYREQLHCVKTVFTILSGQGQVLNIDPLRFYSHLYRNLFLIHAGRSHPDTLSVLQTLDMAMIQRRKKVSQQRMIAFTKRLATLAMQLLPNGSLGCLAVIRTMMHLNRSVDILLDTDTSVGQGLFFPELDDPEYCNASNSALWELTSLERHYHPTVRKFARNILFGVPATGEGCLAPDLTKLKPEELFTEFDPSEMMFRPAVPVPRKVTPKSRPPAHLQFKDDSFASYVKMVSESTVSSPVDFSQILLSCDM